MSWIGASGKVTPRARISEALHLRQDGSSDYADDSKLRTDGPDAIPAMQVIANKVDVVLDRIGSDIRHFRVGQHGKIIHLSNRLCN